MNHHCSKTSVAVKYTLKNLAWLMLNWTIITYHLPLHGCCLLNWWVVEQAQKPKGTKESVSLIRSDVFLAQLASQSQTHFLNNIRTSVRATRGKAPTPHTYLISRGSGVRIQLTWIFPKGMFECEPTLDWRMEIGPRKTLADM